jgi:ribosome-binding protein aMBF1 (putative translation factor)
VRRRLPNGGSAWSKSDTSSARDAGDWQGPGGSGSHAGTHQARKRGVALAVCTLRKEARLSRTTLAERSGLSSSWISRLESGEPETTYGSLRCLADGLGVPMSRLAKTIEALEQS